MSDTGVSARRTGTGSVPGIDLVQNERDECQSATSVLTAVDEAGYRLAHLDRRFVADEPSRECKDPPRTQGLYLGLELVGTAPETGGEPLDIKDRIGVAVEEDKDVPRQERADMLLHELHDGRP